MINNKTYTKILATALLVETTIIIIGATYFLPLLGKDKTIPVKNDSYFYYIFNVEEVLEETSTMDVSPSPYWWVNSGGYISIANNVGSTPSAKESLGSKWQVLYQNNNPTDTDGGLYPQNLFRMITKSRWLDFQQEAYFKIKEYNLSPSSNRNLSNGLFLLTRYEDEDNTYYTGLRVDGNAIVKKKVAGEYFTLAEKKFWEGNVYDREENPIVLPKNVWIGIKSEVRNIAPNKVMIEMFVDIGKTGTWTSVMEVLDDGTIGGNTLSNKGFAGIRTDFMDVEFSDYLNVEI